MLDAPLQNVDVSSSTQMMTRSVKGARSQEDMMAAAKDFESVFMAQMIKPMWDSVEVDPVFGGGHGEEAMRDLLLQEYGKSMAAADNYELATSVMGEMIKIQNKLSGASAQNSQGADL